MQEQVPSNITPDHGWSTMKTILDREMPVSRRSRRGIFFWRSLMAVGLVASFGYLIWDSMPGGSNATKDNAPLQQEQRINPDIPAKETPKPVEQAANDPSSQDQQPMASVDGASEKINSGASASAAINQQTNANTTTVTGSSFAEAKSATVHKAAKSIAEENSVSLRFGEPVPNADKPAAVVADQSFSTALDHNLTASPDETEIGSVQKIESQANAMRKGQVVAALPGLSIDQLPVTNSDALDLAYIESTPVIVQQATFKRGIAPYVATHAMAGYNHGAAWQGGAGISIAALPKLRLSAGVSYRTYNPRFSIIRLETTQSQDGPGPGESIVEADDLYPGIPNYVQEFSLNASTSYQSIEPLVKSIRQWQVDAGISYDVSKRWFLRTGIAYALQTRGYSAYPIIEEPFTADPTRVSVNRELDDYDLIQNGMISWSGGIGYHIGNRLDVSVEAVHSFTPYLQPDPVSGSNFSKSTTRNDFIRGISVGAKYRI